MAGLAYVHRERTTVELCERHARELVARGWTAGPHADANVSPEELAAFGTVDALALIGCMVCSGERSIDAVDALAGAR